jgi:hypothetical protein
MADKGLTYAGAGGDHSLRVAVESVKELAHPLIPTPAEP